MDPQKLNLSGGNRNSSRVYTAPNGVTVISSHNTYSNSNYYYLAYLFNGTYSGGATTYWLTNGGKASGQTLTFDFSKLPTFYLKEIRVYPYTRTDTSSDYIIHASEDGKVWTEIQPWASNSHISSNPNYVRPGTARSHFFETRLPKFIRFTFKNNGSWGASCNEIEFYGFYETVIVNVPEEVAIEREGTTVPIEFLTLGFTSSTSYTYKVTEIAPRNKEILINTSPQKNDKEIALEFNEEYFDRYGWHGIQVEVLINGEQGIYSTVKEFKVKLDNSPPDISISKEGNNFTVNIEDRDGDNVAYKVLLNGEKILPIDEEVEYEETGYFEVTYSRIILSNELIIGEDNTLTVEAVDSWGEKSTKDLVFTAEYVGLMFADMGDNFYSTDLGKVLKYLMPETMMAGTSSLIYPIKLINMNSFKVSNLLLTKSERDLQGVTVQLSKEEVPFLVMEELRYSGLELDVLEELIFYVRIKTDPSAMGGGMFDIYVKADPL